MRDSNPIPSRRRAAPSPGPGRRPPLRAVPSPRGRTEAPCWEALVLVDREQEKHPLSIQLRFWGQTCNAPSPSPSARRGDSRWWLETRPASGHPQHQPEAVEAGGGPGTSIEAALRYSKPLYPPGTTPQLPKK